MHRRPWLAHYPESVPHEIDLSRYASLGALFEDSFQRFRERSAFVFMGKSMSYGELDEASRTMAAYFQSLGLRPGDRVAVMMPNVMQYPVCVAAVLRAGLVLVNVNPLYTPRELRHQLNDSGAKALVIIENFARTFQEVRREVGVEHVVLATMGDSLGLLKGLLVNTVVRHVKKLVPAFDLPGAVPWPQALAQGRQARFTAPEISPDAIAALQYTGGTTGVSKGAVLSHRNLIANTLQCLAWMAPAANTVPAGQQVTLACALPLYHIFAFTANMMFALALGGRNLLIPNPRDLPALFKTLRANPVHIFPAVNTLFQGMLNHPDFATVDWSQLKISLGGGMAVQSKTAKDWLARTGCAICEGYGLSETSPVVSANLVNSREFTGTIGLPLPGTDVAILDDAGQPVPDGQPGEISVRGPQVMQGYWQRPDETAKVMTPDGYFRTGDIGVLQESGRVKIVDRKKDMILVSGFNVYPNEIEDVMTQMPGVLECACVGVPDEHTGEAVKIVVVLRDPAVTEAQIRTFCSENLTGYKRPRHIEFRTELPKTPVGKILRRELRDKTA
ncbi:long-chain-fatty-acid--CoA ligase [Amphibiibacter pelophylacis]|uniref:Long-chain-fatty-acid--CoA ligase n=1 Tax=Amphibiibacter pelophylacis TaxID=1799477 RepID=A0ACC6P4U4_9BURK